MAITITPEQRDALYEQVMDHLSAIDDVRLAAEQEKFDAAERLAREFADELRLLNDDLGWGRGKGTPVELRNPPDVLRRVFERLLDAVAKQRQAEETERVKARQMERRASLINEACTRVLAGLDASPDTP